jgi:hypothetical protein
MLLIQERSIFEGLNKCSLLIPQLTKSEHRRSSQNSSLPRIRMCISRVERAEMMRPFLCRWMKMRSSRLPVHRAPIESNRCKLCKVRFVANRRIFVEYSQFDELLWLLSRVSRGNIRLFLNSIKLKFFLQTKLLKIIHASITCF